MNDMFLFLFKNQKHANIGENLLCYKHNNSIKISLILPRSYRKYSYIPYHNHKT